MWCDKCWFWSSNFCWKRSHHVMNVSCWIFWWRLGPFCFQIFFVFMSCIVCTIHERSNRCPCVLPSPWWLKCRQRIKQVWDSLVDCFIVLTPLRTSLASSKATQVVSRQEVEPENQIVLKRARQEDHLIQHSRSSSIPSSLVSRVPCLRHVALSSAVSRTICRIGWVPANGCSESEPESPTFKSNWHIPLHNVRRCHHHVIKYHIYVCNSHIEKHSSSKSAPERDNHFIQ